MHELVKLVTEIPDQKERKDEDFSDRLSSSYTVIMLLVFAGVVGMNQYVGMYISVNLISQVSNCKMTYFIPDFINN